MNGKKVIFWIIQCTWGIIQTLIGLCVVLCLALKNHVGFCMFENALCIYIKDGSKSGSAATFGFFICFFMGYSDSLVEHEYGHCIQSLILGPLWVFVIGIPSIIWFSRFDGYRENHGIGYYDFYTERWASNLGAKFSR